MRAGNALVRLRSFHVPTFVRAASLAAAFLPAIAAAEPISFDQAISLAVQRSEAARAAQATVQSSTHYVRAASQLPDPMLRAGIDNLPVTGSDRWSSTRESMTMKRIGISQEWISADKRAARENAARSKADRDVAQKSVVEADARLQAALAYVDAWFAGGAQADHPVRASLARGAWRLQKPLGSCHGQQRRSAAALSAKGIAEDESEEVRQQQAAAMVSLQRWIGVLPDALLKLPTFSAFTNGTMWRGIQPSLGCKAKSKSLARTQASLRRSAPQIGPGRCPMASALAIPT